MASSSIFTTRSQGMNSVGWPQAVVQVDSRSLRIWLTKAEDQVGEPSDAIADLAGANGPVQ